ncbi:hypothetical protein H097_15951 [Pseudomonas sp. FH4]|jgi:hypothetical protein|uniref:hypothetical protein n=1 Tax=Pseudomonas fluorescens group TaxID=136843 RepID=UPI0003DC7742|nr:MULTISPECIES: hypothetical protein [Pseudomonas fluorescens group]ETK17488.1 hypothetical protein H097_15951 [Pseudomonas sp. FH4]KAA6179987.1 hypothetical protein F3K50_01700 [Pseudomonas marginalis]MBF8003131.1 hypothetical protein [Pseudomonas brenneri]WJM93845.1 hypothetical protein QDY63_13520 [Pseudomonas brenneri]
MSVNFPGGNHHIFSNIIPVTPENRPAAKSEAKASPEESKRWLEEVTSEKGDQKLAMGGGYNALSMAKWMESPDDVKDNAGGS